MSHARPLDPGSALRFVVATKSNLFSFTYTLFSSTRSSDLYLAPRYAKGLEKISFHQSGRWSHSITSENEDRVERNFAGRHLDIWQRPTSGESDWTRAYYIAVPYSELRRSNGRFIKKGTKAFPPNPWRWTVFHLLYAPSEPTDLAIGTPFAEMGRMKLLDGTTVVLIATEVVPDATTLRFIAEQRNAMLSELEENPALAQAYVAEDVDLYQNLFMEDANGVHGFVEISLYLPPEDEFDICKESLRPLPGIVRRP